MDIKDRRFGIVSSEPEDDMYMDIDLSEGDTKVERTQNGVILIQSLYKIHLNTQLLKAIAQVEKEL